MAVGAPSLPETLLRQTKTSYNIQAPLQPQSYTIQAPQPPQTSYNIQAPPPPPETSNMILAPPPPPPTLTCTALYDFTATAPDQLSMKEGEQLSVLEENLEGGWTLVNNCQGSRGRVPASYVKIGDEYGKRKFSQSIICSFNIIIKIIIVL